MLEKALFKKHTRLILYMASGKYFSQKELIAWCLKNKEFRDKDSIENKGQYRDKLIALGVLKKYTFREFMKIYPKETESACHAYRGQHERKRCLLVFDSGSFIGLDFPKLKNISLPFQEYAKDILTKKVDFDIFDIVRAFIFGCSIQRLLLLNEKLSRDMAILAESKPEIDERLLPLVSYAKETMEKMLKEKIS